MYIMYICTLIDGRKRWIITPDGLNQLKLTNGFARLKAWNRNGNTRDRLRVIQKGMEDSYTSTAVVAYWPKSYVYRRAIQVQVFSLYWASRHSVAY